VDDVVDEVDLGGIATGFVRFSPCCCCSLFGYKFCSEEIIERVKPLKACAYIWSPKKKTKKMNAASKNIH
jgi:hypothetical protein